MKQLKKGMKLALVIAVFMIAGALAPAVKAQDVCPAGKVCISQDTANKLFDTVNQLIAAKDAIAALMKERGASDVVVAQAQKVIAGYAQLEVINGKMIASYEQVISLQQKTMEMYSALVDKLTAQINKPKSTWAKILDGLKAVGYILTGIALGHAL